MHNNQTKNLPKNNNTTNQIETIMSKNKYEVLNDPELNINSSTSWVDQMETEQSQHTSFSLGDHPSSTKSSQLCLFRLI